MHNYIISSGTEHPGGSGCRRVEPQLFTAFVALIVPLALGAGGPANTPPTTPTINEPGIDGQIVNPADVHMESAPFSDPDLGDTHLCSDWEIWTTAAAERVWFTSCIGGVERIHTHLGDGAFENSHAGLTELHFDTDYRLRTRHRDSSDEPSTEWSDWAERLFTTGSPAEVFSLELDDILDSPPPQWMDTVGGDIILDGGGTPPGLRIESVEHELLLEVRGLDGVTNQLINPPPIAAHRDVRVVVDGGSNGPSLVLPDSDLSFVNDEGENITIYLPAMEVANGQPAYFWVSADGSTFAGNSGQVEPDFSELARGAPVPWTVSQPGFKVEVAATGFQLPVNIAFHPNPAPLPGDPYYYVTELYGAIKVVTRDGAVSDYAAGLLNFNPTGAFPGSGEQGLAGIVVDPATGDVFASLLYDAGGPHYPKVDRFSSVDGGMTAATQTTILDMFGEPQGQSHQISNLTIGPDGKLYVHVGDGFDASTAQNLDSYRGKILRVNLDGSAPLDNPFYDAGDGINARDYVFAYGVRNPFGGAWRSADGFHYEVENGPSQDRFARVVEGRNYLWNGSNGSMVNFALYVWNPSHAPVNLAFIEPEVFGGSGFPADKNGHAFVSESGPTYATGPQALGKRITEYVIDTNGVLVSGPTNLIEYNGTGKATIVALAAGPDGLYFSDFYKDVNFVSPIDRGAKILRIRFVGTADFTADETTGPAPLTVQFTDTSNAPGITAWSWDFGDSGTSGLQNPTHTYTSEGIFHVQLRVTSAGGVRISQKNAFIRVGEFHRIAFIGGSIPLTLSDSALTEHLRLSGFDVLAFDDEPANRPSAQQLAVDYDLVIISSTVASANIAGEFRNEPIPLIHWEQALNQVSREPLSDGGGTVVGTTLIDVLTNGHPVTTNMPLGPAQAFNPSATMSVANGSVGPGVTVLATENGAPTNYAVMVAEAGVELLGGHIAPARRVFLYLEDNSWLSATDTTKQILDQAVLWALGQEVPTRLGDFDKDGDVDLDDYGSFAPCLLGPTTSMETGCEFADLDEDDNADLEDFAEFQTALTD